MGEQFRQRLQELPDITHTKLSISPAAPKVEFQLDEEKLRRLGLERTQVAALVDGYLRGRFGGAVIEDTEQLRVRAKLEREAWQDSDELLNLQIPSQDNSGSHALCLSPQSENLTLSPMTRLSGAETVSELIRCKRS